jgi:hypothetical protein
MHPRTSQNCVELWRGDRLAREAARSLHERVVTAVAPTELDVVLRSGAKCTKTSIPHRACSPASIASVLFPSVVENNPNEEKITMTLLLVLIAVVGSWPW